MRNFNQSLSSRSFIKRRSESNWFVVFQRSMSAEKRENHHHHHHRSDWVHCNLVGESKRKKGNRVYFLPSLVYHQYFSGVRLFLFDWFVFRQSNMRYLFEVDRLDSCSFIHPFILFKVNDTIDQRIDVDDHLNICFFSSTHHYWVNSIVHILTGKFFVIFFFWFHSTSLSQ